MARELEINVTELSKTIASELDYLPASVRSSMTKVIKKAAKQGISELKQTSPKLTGDYAGGWTSRLEDGDDGVGVIIYNSKKPWLTHLLEHGHLIKKTGGRTRAFPHIAPAQANVGAFIASELERMDLSK